MRAQLRLLVSSILVFIAAAAPTTQRLPAGEVAEPKNVRKPASDADLRYWLENMFWHHRFTVAEVWAATGLHAADATAALKTFGQGKDVEAEFRRTEETGSGQDPPKDRDAVRVRGDVVDADSGKPIPCRLYIQKEDGAWFFPTSASSAGSAIS